MTFKNVWSASFVLSILSEIQNLFKFQLCEKPNSSKSLKKIFGDIERTKKADYKLKTLGLILFMCYQF